MKTGSLEIDFSLVEEPLRNEIEILQPREVIDYLVKGMNYLKQNAPSANPEPQVLSWNTGAIDQIANIDWTNDTFFITYYGDENLISQNIINDYSILPMQEGKHYKFFIKTNANALKMTINCETNIAGFDVDLNVDVSLFIDFYKINNMYICIVEKTY